MASSTCSFPKDPLQKDEVAVQNGSVNGKWVEIPGAELLTDVQLEAAVDAVGAFGFIRTEDGAFSKSNPNEFYFVTTGGGTGNVLGRMYQLNLNPASVTGDCRFTVIYNADQIDTAGGDVAFAPDNIDTSRDFIFVCEDGTSQSRPEYAARAREASIWRFDIKNNFAAKRIVELNPPGTDTIPVPTPGTWETSGVIDTSALFGKGSALFDVQAHGPTIAPAPNTVEDGQLLLMRRCDKDHGRGW